MNSNNSILKNTLKVKDLTFNFMPGWWAKYHGIKFGEKYYTDPEYRMKTTACIRKLQKDEMGDLLINEPDLSEIPVGPDYGNATTGAFAGCEVQFPEDGAAWNKRLPEEKLKDIRLPEKLEESYPYQGMIEQVLYMNEKYGRRDLPTILPRGILNEAFLIGGEKILTDMYDDPDEARRVLDFSFELLRMTVEYNASLGYRGLVRVLNCTVKLIGPDMYKEWLLPYDMRIYELAAKHNMTFGVHHCGRLDPVMDHYRSIPEFRYLQMGFGSDLEKAIALFPEAELRYVIDPFFCMNASPNEISEKIEDILKQAGDNAKYIAIDVGAIDYGTPIENLRAIKETLSN